MVPCYCHAEACIEVLKGAALKIQRLEAFDTELGHRKHTLQGGYFRWMDKMHNKY